MMAITDLVYNVINSFVPQQLLNVPFFGFLANLGFFIFCCWLFALFFIFPLLSVWRWFKCKVGAL